MNTLKKSSPASLYAKALIVDDGWVREFLLSNFHPITARAFRSGQPSPRHLRKRIQQHGIRSIVNLRGYDPENPMLQLEEAICAEMNVELIHLRMLSRALPSLETLEQAHHILQRIPFPTWFHCKSGADRAGLMSALYLHWIEGVPIGETHQLQLWPFFHYRWAKTGLLDHFLEAYQAHAETQPDTLLEWARKHYDREQLTKQFRYHRISTFFVDFLLRRE